MIDRRRVLFGGAAAAVVALLGSGCGGLRGRAVGLGGTADGGTALGFTGVPVGMSDAVVVPAEYAAQVLYRWGDATGLVAGWPGATHPFADNAANTADEQAAQAGMHHDGMHFFALPGGNDRGLLVLNHEYTDEGLLHTDGVAIWTSAKVCKSQHAMGISVIEIERDAAGDWHQMRPSPYARRIHARTPCRIAGPAAGKAALQTALDPSGREVLGTLANCAMGVTPWGTYLSCEENFHGYFGGPAAAAADATAAQRRYGTVPGAHWVDWWRFDTRFDLTQHPNEANRFGWVVELDPFDPQAAPIKRTALGRKRHESATCRSGRDGRVAIYMGDDSRFEYIYKFVTRDAVRPGGARANADLLDHGTLHVARFDADGRGAWLPLIYGHHGLDAAAGFASQADVVLKARLAADIVGATPMDRPEWIAVHPDTGEVFATLTANTQRGDHGRPPADAANPRAPNPFGHIVRWREDADDACATGFAWSHYLLAGDPALPASGARYPFDAAAGAVAPTESPITTPAISNGTALRATTPSPAAALARDALGNPDGIYIDPAGLLWIQTDMSGQDMHTGAFAALGNNALLCADLTTGGIKRFLTGPPGCEVTGCTVTADRRTLFVNIQHPGEARDDAIGPTLSSWPDGGPVGSVRPRSATVAVRRRDGGPVGT